MRLIVTGLGMVTALGYGSVGSCAAIRAGLALPGALDGFEVGDDDGGSRPVTGFPVSGYAEGFFLAGAWLRLAAGSLDDLRHSAGWPPASDAAFWNRTGLIALTPFIDTARFGWSLEQRPRALQEEFLHPLLALQRLPVTEERCRILAAGHCGLAVALREARRLLTERYLERVIIVAADSYTDRPSLEWIDGQRRLKQPLQPVGLMPGQAGACLLVEAEGVARARGAPQIIQVGGASQAAPPGGRSRAPELGRALAESLLQVLHAAEAPTPFRGSLVVDLNGEEWKAAAWGHAQVHLVRHVDFERCRLRIPAESLGELGAASAAVGAGVAISDLIQGDDADVGAIVCSLSDVGEVGAVLFQRIREF
jgi:3-oxoacyl-[acyl-carrier-protein] synthase-1